jgi:hypothetical protein
MANLCITDFSKLVGKVLEVFNAKLGRADILKPTIGNENLHRISNENEDRLSKYNRIKSTMLSHSNIREFTSMFPDDKTHNQIDHILIDRRRHSHVHDIRSFRAVDCDAEQYLVATKLESD